MSLSSQAGEAEAGELLEPRSSGQSRQHKEVPVFNQNRGWRVEERVTLISGVDNGRGDIRKSLSMSQTGFSVGICRSEDPDKAR